MIGISWAAVLALTAWGAVAPPPPKPVTVHMVAIYAETVGRAHRFFDPGLEAFRADVAEIQADTFHKVAGGSHIVGFKHETKFRVTRKCAVYVTPEALESNGLIKLDVRIETRNEKTGRSCNALKVRCAVVPGEKFKYRLKMRQGELVVILSVTQ